MWTVVYLAKNKKMADKVSTLMSQEGLLVKVRPICRSKEEDDNYFELLVPESEIEEAHTVLCESGL